MGFLDKLFGRSADTAPSTRPEAKAPPAQQPSRTLKAPRGRGSIQWVPPGESVSLWGQTIQGGMLYVGSRATAGNGHSVEPALIDPTLSVKWKHPDRSGSTMGYWPSYAELSPGARAAYLTWLLDGRSRPDAYIGYVFLYFYGLERRVLLDIGANSAHPDLPVVAAEVRRLLSIYGHNNSFRSYASSFLDYLDTVTARTAALTAPDWSAVDRSWEVPAVVRVALGRFAAAGEPIPAEWALVLLRTHPESYLRTPATRCHSEFDELFKQRYRNKHGAGLVVRPPKTCVEVQYRPASGGLRGDYRRTLDDIPDITKISGPINKVRDLAADCTDALDAYSRYIGRNPDAAGEPAAIGLLPDELLATHGGEALENLRTWTAAATANGPAPVIIDDVVEQWSPGKPPKLTKKDAVSLAGLLTKLGIGMEPDVRFGGKTPLPGSTVILFPVPAHAPAAPSAPYAAASVLVHLTAVVAAADGAVGDDERRHLASHLEASLGLDEAECARLEAHLAWLTADKPSLAGVKRRLDALSTSQRGSIGHFLVDLAAADGVVSPEEITTLTKLYKLLGLDEADVYRVVHALGTDTGPVTVRPANADPSRWAIPEPGTTPQPVRLDGAKVQARLAETATVTALLADIFTEDDIEAPTAPSDPPTASEATKDESVIIDGLDAAHSALADRLCARPSWERGDAEDIAVELGLPLLDGALDRVNEAALDACGEPLIEGDDPLDVNDYAAQELFA